MNILTEKIINATGYADYQIAFGSLYTAVSGFIDSFNNAINKAAIRNAVQAQITQIVFNLLSGCSGEVADLTLNSNVKSAIAGYVTLAQAESEGKVYIDPNGNVTTQESVIDATTTTTTVETNVLPELPTIAVEVVSTPVAEPTNITSSAVGPSETAKIENQTAPTTTKTPIQSGWTAVVQILDNNNVESKTFNLGTGPNDYDSILNFVNDTLKPYNFDAYKVRMYENGAEIGNALIVNNPAAALAPLKPK